MFKTNDESKMFLVGGGARGSPHKGRRVYKKKRNGVRCMYWPTDLNPLSYHL